MSRLICSPATLPRSVGFWLTLLYPLREAEAAASGTGQTGLGWWSRSLWHPAGLEVHAPVLLACLYCSGPRLRHDAQGGMDRGVAGSLACSGRSAGRAAGPDSFSVGRRARATLRRRRAHGHTARSRRVERLFLGCGDVGCGLRVERRRRRGRDARLARAHGRGLALERVTPRACRSRGRLLHLQRTRGGGLRAPRGRRPAASRSSTSTRTSAAARGAWSNAGPKSGRWTWPSLAGSMPTTRPASNASPSTWCASRTQYLAVVNARLEGLPLPLDVAIYNAGMDVHEDCRTGGRAGFDAAVLPPASDSSSSGRAARVCQSRSCSPAGTRAPACRQDRLVALHRMTIETAAGVCRGDAAERAGLGSLGR